MRHLLSTPLFFGINSSFNISLFSYFSYYFCLKTWKSMFLFWIVDELIKITIHFFLWACVYIVSYSLFFNYYCLYFWNRHDLNIFFSWILCMRWVATIIIIIILFLLSSIAHISMKLYYSIMPWKTEEGGAGGKKIDFSQT